ncbi:MAG: MbnP family protein [Saprospiraceae bacterium]
MKPKIKLLDMNSNKFFLLVFLIPFLFSACKDDKAGQLEIVYKLQYDGSPLVMFQEYEYPDGRKIEFTRFSFYTSDVKLDQEVLKDVEFHNLTVNNVDLDGATNGYSWIIDDVPSGDYDNLIFNIGLTEDQNSKTPEDFSTDHPLARSAEHWFNWNSYVFAKVEGKIDTNTDGEKNQSIALHLGSNSAKRSISLSKNTTISSDEKAVIEVTIDLYDFFGGADNTYDIDNNPMLHKLEQMPQVVELADNFKNSVK